jgi:phage-related protein
MIIQKISQTYEMHPNPIPPISWDEYAKQAYNEYQNLLKNHSNDESVFQRFFESHPSDELPKNEKAEGLTILEKLEDEGLAALEVLNTRQLRGKLWEIKFFDYNRIMYVVADGNNIYLVHACKKQKGKAERFELDKAIKRVKELENELSKIFI